MIFEIEMLPRLNLKGQVYPGFGRIYTRWDGKRFPSVTTCLSKVDVDDKDVILQEWRAEVGEEEANRVQGRALTRGRSIHRMAEKYVLGQNWRLGAMPLNLELFQGVRKYLDDHLTTVWGTEMPLFSEQLGVAGCADLVGRFMGETAVLDFKGSNRRRNPNVSYWLQTAIYALMVSERYGINIDTLVIIMAYEDDKPEMFVDALDGWDQMAVEVIAEGRKRLGEERTWPESA